jgi:hypothetical protein
LAEAELEAVEKDVSRIRGGKSKTAARARHRNDTTSNGIRTQVEDDKCEGPLRVPNSVLDGCESSFKAADKLREKASTQFFDDTGLMALICRHDRVLWLANTVTQKT